MRRNQILAGCLVAALVAGCGPARQGTFNEDVIGGNPDDVAAESTIWDVFGPNTQDQTINVNKYIWGASLDVLSFLPIREIDPFSGVIVTDYGTPPGGGKAYRATVYITDPALDARSLRVALQSRSGPVDAATTRAVEDAILSRARQIRIAADKL
ncbi:MAG: DUF3576 domain-containing protein [Marinibacterium sp.]|nr:DUF3576 domain-containing protein [Marinibacterium sp.]